MKKQLILTLNTLNSNARIPIWGQVQTELFAMGYSWSEGGKSIQHTYMTQLIVHHTYASPQELIFSGSVEPISCKVPTVIFDSQQIPQFLRMARESSTIHTTIENMNVVITPNNITFTPSAEFIGRVESKAKDIQKEAFGN